MDQTLFDASIGALTARMRAGTLSPVELVDAHIERATALDKRLNIFTRTRFEAARDEARAAESRYRRGQAGPLAGVPFSVKEMIAVAGMPQTAGISARRDVVADSDATVVRRLRRAGAILLGVTNVSEGGMWMETDNRVHGRTSNPWDRRRTPGGSSGGEAALISAGGAVFGVGSDIGGSIRIPAGLCGVPGHKPTGGLVPNTGHWPNDGGTGTMLNTGPIARSVDDLWLLLGLMAGPDGLDWSVRWERPRQSPDSIDLSQVRVFPLERMSFVQLQPPLRDAMQRATEALAARGAQVEPMPPRLFDRALALWALKLFSLETESFDHLLGGPGGVRLLRQTLRAAIGRAEHTGISLAVVAFERISYLIGGAGPGRVPEGLATLQQTLEDLLGRDGVILHPPYPRPAPRHRVALLRPFEFVCSGIFNALEFPSTVVPVGFTTDGLPVTTQVVAARGQDHLALACAKAIERTLGGWVRARPMRDEAG